MTPALDQILAALADPARRTVIERLCQQPLSAGDLARETGLSAAALSRHLRILRQLGMIAEAPLSRDARVRVYALRPQPMADLKTWLSQQEALWSRQVETVKRDYTPA
jgi:DNA-binding transcriptional ArsR family regulator